MAEKSFNFGELVTSIEEVHLKLQARAGRAVDISRTMRNWLIGCYIAEYQMRGADRAKYGEHLLKDLATDLKSSGMKGVAERELRKFIIFYKIYPQIWDSVSLEFIKLLSDNMNIDVQIIRGSLTPKLGNKAQDDLKTDFQLIRGTLSPELQLSGNELVNKLSFSHFLELIAISDPYKRVFYEIESMRGCWSVRDLKKQIGKLYYERSAMSENKEELAKIVNSESEQYKPELVFQDPYFLDFAGLNMKDIVTESDLETELIDKIQAFLLELGHGFCFEARQKRILDGRRHSFIDLVFYHRILRCHVLIELKMSEFSYQHFGQLNSYVNWYHLNMREQYDNPPVGLLLCTEKDGTMVKYALAGMEDKLFVSKYQIELPDVQQIREFVEKLVTEASS